MSLPSIQPAKLLHLTGIILLLALYAAVLACLLHPHVTREYRAFYIDRVSTDWHPIRYPATPETGIRFNTPGLPDFVEYVYGFSYREPWGRWTDAAHSPTKDKPVAGIVFTRDLTGPICVDLNARTALANEPIDVVLGDQERSVVFGDADFSDYFLEYQPTRPARTIEFRFPHRLRSVHGEHAANFDRRSLGLALVYLRVFRETCATLKARTAQAQIAP